MAKGFARKISRAGTYGVKAAESRSTKVAARKGRFTSTVTLSDRNLASELLKTKRSR